ncbi:DUF4328 domain-containing protein [Haloferula sp.]|uniref:DUF4328 domain-containing protein n=1 Tax=Haloferula sp. TaxID=2497595 RepID=UPI003C782C0E
MIRSTYQELGALDGGVDQHNPYATPQSAEPAVDGDPLYAKVDDPGTLGRTCISLLIVTTVFDLLSYFLVPMLSLESPLFGPLSLMETVSGWLMLVYLVAFLCWNYRVLRNAKRVAPDRMTVSPGMGVGSYFIPILNFWVPAKALLQASRITGTSTGLVLVWWILTQAFLVFVIVYGFWVFSGASITPEMMEGSVIGESQDDWVITFLTLMDPVMVAIEVPMIWALSQRQRDWAQRS